MKHQLEEFTERHGVAAVKFYAIAIIGNAPGENQRFRVTVLRNGETVYLDEFKR